MITDLQKRTCKAIVRIFETGRIAGNYAAISRSRTDRGGLSYGISQASLNSGNLSALIEEYIKAAGISERAKIMPYREELRTKADLLNRDPNIVRILQELAKDPLMRKCQDGFFDSRFWMPAEDFCRFAEMTTPLAHAVVYDSVIQGSLGKVRKMFPEVPPNKGGEEKAWVRAYLRARKPFLISLGGDAEKSTYRVDELQKVADADNWNLNLPLTVRGLTITEALLR